MRGFFRSRAWRKFRRDRLAMVGLSVIAIYVLIAVWVRVGGLGWVGASQDEPIVTENQEIAFYTDPSGESWQHWLGTDRQGRSILVRAISSIRIAISVGFVTALVSVTIGTVLGVLAGYYRGRMDDFVVWLYSTLDSIPYLLLLLVLSYSARRAFADVDPSGLLAVYVAFGATFWVGPCRVIRGEAIKVREMEFVQAAHSMGASRPWIAFRHVFPNVVHLSLIYFSLLFIGAIKAEVILSFLNLGVKNQASWGIMIDQARAELAVDIYWQIGAATAFMFVLVLAFNVFTDALQDALDPKNT